MLTTAERLLTISTSVVLVAGLASSAEAAFGSSTQIASETGAGVVEMQLRAVDEDTPTALDVSGLLPGGRRTFAQALVAAGTVPVDATLLVSEAVGEEDDCATSDMEELFGGDCDPDGEGQLATTLRLRLHVWSSPTPSCAATPPGPPVHDDTIAAADGLRTTPQRVPAGGALCVRGEVELPLDAMVTVHGDRVRFRTTGEQTDAPATTEASR